MNISKPFDQWGDLTTWGEASSKSYDSFVRFSFQFQCLFPLDFVITWLLLLFSFCQTVQFKKSSCSSQFPHTRCRSIPKMEILCTKANYFFLPWYKYMQCHSPNRNNIFHLHFIAVMLGQNLIRTFSCYDERWTSLNARFCKYSNTLPVNVMHPIIIIDVLLLFFLCTVYYKIHIYISS